MNAQTKNLKVKDDIFNETKVVCYCYSILTKLKVS